MVPYAWAFHPSELVAELQFASIARGKGTAIIV